MTNNQNPKQIKKQPTPQEYKRIYSAVQFNQNHIYKKLYFQKVFINEICLNIWFNPFIVKTVSWALAVNAFK